jgi:hypothetical protein
MSENDDGGSDPLQPILVALTGRTLTMGDVQKAVGLSKPQYYAARREGKLLTANRLIQAANTLAINPVQLLVACGLVSLKDAADLVEDRRKQATEFWEATGRPLPMLAKRKGMTVRPPELTPAL